MLGKIQKTNDSLPSLIQYRREKPRYNLLDTQLYNCLTVVDTILLRHYLQADVPQDTRSTHIYMYTIHNTLGFHTHLLPMIDMTCSTGSTTWSLRISCLMENLIFSISSFVCSSSSHTTSSSCRAKNNVSKFC